MNLEIRGQDPLCLECMPALLPENQEAAKVYSMVCNQAITAGMAGTVLDINFESVLKIIDLYGVEDRFSVFEKVVKTFRKTVMEKQREHQDGGRK